MSSTQQANVENLVRDTLAAHPSRGPRNDRPPGAAAGGVR
jgi:hypothetical protein